MASTKHLAKRIIDIMNPLGIRKDAVIADMGCQHGYLLNHLHKNGYSNLTGYDIIKLENTSNFKFIRADLNTIKPIEPTYDIIIHSELMEHLENIYHFIRFCSKALKPGGVMIMTTPNQQKLMDKLFFTTTGENTRFYNMKNNRTIITKRILNHIFKENNLKVIKWSYNYSKVPLTKLKFFPTKWFGNSHLIILKKDNLSD